MSGEGLRDLGSRENIAVLGGGTTQNTGQTPQVAERKFTTYIKLTT